MKSELEKKLQDLYQKYIAMCADLGDFQYKSKAWADRADDMVKKIKLVDEEASQIQDKIKAMNDAPVEDKKSEAS